jgi:hypothetical protein
MVMILDILEDYMNYRGFKFERIDGGVRGSDRQVNLDLILSLLTTIVNPIGKN